MNKMNDNIDASILTEEDSKTSDETTGIFVSLYLIVLSFFIVLNSISNQEQNKVNAATESVTRAFKNPYEPEADFIDVMADKVSITPNDEFYDQIQGLFASLIGFEGRFPTKGGSVIKVKFKASDLFEEGTSEFRSDQQPFFEQLALFLNGGRESEKREIDIVISSGKKLPVGPTYWKNINILRAGAFVHRLKKMGVEENKLSIGMVQGNVGTIILTFYNQERIKTKQTLSEYGARKQLSSPKQTIPQSPVSENNIENRNNP